MIQRQFQALINNEPNRTIHHHWVDADHISWTAKLAAITSEDQRFPQHRGFDLEQIQKALQESRRGESLRGASTITQQTAKNLFLWPGRNYLRKGLEAYFTILLELCWPKERILEVYLNSAEFGSGIYGVQKAAEIFFNTTANKLSKSQSALLVTALPSPRRYNVAAPSDYMIRRQQWVLQYMNALGNQAYLKSL